MPEHGPFVSRAARLFIRWFLVFLLGAFAGAALSLCARAPLSVGRLPSDFRGAVRFFGTACRSNAVLLAAAALFMPSALCRSVLALGVLHKGAAFGCSLGMASRGLLAVSHPVPVFLIYFASCLLILALASLTERLSAAVCRQASRPRRVLRLAGAYLCPWAVCSGGVFGLTLLGTCFL
ncbi:MAG: hypothetical protein IKQ92_15770 [Clostridia bacterium]|nr:hypothetical protein [Clostridia bacterium]